MGKNTLKSLVPPLDLCKKAAGIVGDDTALVWCEGESDSGVFERDSCAEMLRKYHAMKYVVAVFPAPTLAEILDKLPCMVGCGFIRIGEDYIEYATADGYVVLDLHVSVSFVEEWATAALNMLMKVKGLENE